MTEISSIDVLKANVESDMGKKEQLTAYVEHAPEYDRKEVCSRIFWIEEDQIVLIDTTKNKPLGYYGSLEYAIKKVSNLSLVSQKEDYTLTGFIESYRNIVNKLTKNFKNV